MLRRTHLAFGLLVSLLIPLDLSPLLYAVIVLFGALFPDIDHPKTHLGRSLGILGKLFTHRGFFHSLFPFLVLLISSHAYVLAFFLGYASHVVLDMFTKQGIMPLHPLSSFKLKGPFKSGGIVDVGLFYVSIFLLGVLLLFWV